MNEIEKRFISGVMNQYSWQLVFDRLEEVGPARIVTLFKLGLKEMPRLEGCFASTIPGERQKAVDEIRALFSRIDLEMNKAISDSKLSPEEFQKEVKKGTHFTPEEWRLLSRIPELIGSHHSELLAKRAYDTPKKKNPFFKA